MSTKEPFATLKLIHPIEIGEGNKITELTFQEPVAEYFLDLPVEVNIKSLISVTSKCTGTPMAHLKRMHAEDMWKCIDIVSRFFPDGPAT